MNEYSDGQRKELDEIEEKSIEMRNSQPII